MIRKSILLIALAAAVIAQNPAPRKIQVLIITGRDDHDWRGATASMRQSLAAAGIFEVRTTEEFRDAGVSSLAPYEVAVLVYNDKDPADRWTDRSREALLGFVRGGKGLVVYHHSAAGFHDWPEFAQLCGGNYYGGALSQNYNIEVFQCLKCATPRHRSISRPRHRHFGVLQTRTRPVSAALCTGIEPDQPA
ncbi:MAG TPA: ThuA domain-containing protein [Bryobacteraceae bacterium]|nr:ThuA domain-containing protein [Bryobacteraceae bacterium]